jgi:hypothetical protein
MKYHVGYDLLSFLLMLFSCCVGAAVYVVRFGCSFTSCFRFGYGLFIVSTFVRLLVVLSGMEFCGVVLLNQHNGGDAPQKKR